MKRLIRNAAQTVDEILESYVIRGGHQRPNDRREFLRAGLITAAGAVFMPHRSLACKDIADVAPSRTGFLSIELAGGPAMQANFVPMTKGWEPATQL